MRFIVMPLAITLAACSTNNALIADESVSPDFVEAMGDTDTPQSSEHHRAAFNLTLDTVTAPAWGHDGVYTVTGANAGETLHVAWSSTGTGMGACPPPLGGQCLGLLNAMLLGTVVADTNGDSTFAVTFPASGPAGATFHLQAIAARGAATILSPVVSDPIRDQDDFVHFPAAVDVLFVVDNSCSMADEQNGLTAAFPTLLDSMFDLGLDFHVGVVSTDMDDPTHSGILREDGGDRWIDASDPDPEVTFTNMASLGTSGSFDEKGKDATVAALETLALTDNVGFRRYDTQLAVVVLSDEDDSSSINNADFVGWIEGEVLRPQDLTFNSIVGPNLGCATASDGQGYYDVTNAVGGVFQSICDGNFDAVMADISDQFYTSVPYELAAVADPATLVVSASEFGGPYVELASTDWEYDAVENTVRLTSSYHPPAGTDITVTYVPL